MASPTTSSRFSYTLFRTQEARSIFLDRFEVCVADHPVILLKDRTVLQWLCGDTSFLPAIEAKNKTRDTIEWKKHEDEWGQTTLEKARPDLRKTGQWTTCLGQTLARELVEVATGLSYTKPTKKDGFEPDGETSQAMWEVKTQTYFTSGTAGEKILGVPYKYADVPYLYQKPLTILCIGGAERDCREHYGILPGDKVTANRQKTLDFWRDELRIEYIGATDLMQDIVMAAKST